MKTSKLIFSIIAIASLSLLGTLGISVAKAATVPSTPAIFDTILSSPLNPSDTMMFIKNGKTSQGLALPSYECFTIDVNTPSLEYVCGMVSGTTVSGLVRNLNGVTATTTAATSVPQHRVGADVRISDFPALTIISNFLSGLDSVSNPIYYDATVATSTIANNRNNLASWGLVQDTAFTGSGAIAATTAAKGYVQLATGIQTASSTAIGSTGASLVVTSSNATSTYNSATAPLKVVVTQNSGFIDQNFINSLATSTTVGNGIPIFQIHLQQQVFTSTGTTTFSVPSGITKVRVKTVAAGGGGGGSAANAGGGGGGGGTSEKIVDITGTSTIQVFVGAGGAGGTSAVGSSGQWSTFGTNGFYISATGGLGGGISSTPNGGAGGIGVGGDLNISGQGGGGGGTLTTAPGGIGGSSSLGGGGAAPYQNAGANGGNYGGGGSGNSGGGGGGGNGAQGVVIVSW